MLFIKDKWIKDEELGFLKANPLIFMTSGIKWKKRIEFLGFTLDVVVSGTSDKLNSTQRKIVVNALSDKEFLEKQVEEVIQELCLKNNMKFEEWADNFQCLVIYIKDMDLYISINDTLNNLTYELELRWFQ